MAASSSPRESAGREPDQKSAALASNAAAVRAVAAAVEGTFGPKGLDCMLVDRTGDVTVTNDGSTILSLMDASHPAARILVRAARAQADEVGDGTTTTVLLAAAMVEEGAEHARRGVPVPMLLQGLREGVGEARGYLLSAACACDGLDDPALQNAVSVAARGDKDITSAAMEAGRIAGTDALHDPAFDLRRSIVVEEGAVTGAFRGILVSQSPVGRQSPRSLQDVRCLVLADALEPEGVDAAALATDRGFSAYLAGMERFKERLDQIVALGVRFVAVQKGVHDIAEEKLGAAGCVLLRRLGSREIAQIAEQTGAAVLKKAGLLSMEDLSGALGQAERVEVDERRGHVVVRGTAAHTGATILVGASTREVADEVKRIAEDACGALQQAVRTGLVGGGGAVELAAALRLEGIRSGRRGMAAYGMDCVIQALKKPISQMAANAGFNPLAVLESAAAAQREQDSAFLGVNCDSGEVADMRAMGVMDPAGVKVSALSTATEVAQAILRIGAIVRMKDAGAALGGEAERTE